MLCALSTEKNPGPKHLLHFPTEKTDQDQTEWQFSLTVTTTGGVCHDQPGWHMHLHTLPIAGPWFMRTWTMNLQRRSHSAGCGCPSVPSPRCTTTIHSSHGGSWGRRIGGLVNAELVTNALEFLSVSWSNTVFCQNKCWHIPQQKGGGAQGRWGSRMERETKRHNWLSFFLLCCSCEIGGIYNTHTYSTGLSLPVYHISRGQMFMHFVHKSKNVYF